MAFDGLLVTEIFHSIQGESSRAGLRFGFIRLTGCNLRCTYCDSKYAFKGGRRMSIEKVVEAIKPFGVRHVLVTGGEPLLQRQTSRLVEALNNSGYEVSVETHGELSIEPIVGHARIIMDIKTPASGESRGGFRQNLALLKPTDEVKFVIASKEDYFWARDIIKSGAVPTREILMSPVVSSVEPMWLASQILADRLPVRLQLQLHKIVWPSGKRGV